MNKINPILPGETLEEDFLKPLGITAYRLSKEINISATRISEILKGK
jgi:addiction module HigA family antidote